MRILLIIGLLLIASPLFAKPSISDRIKTRVEAEIGTDTQQVEKIESGTEDDTTLREKKAKIVDQEVMVDVQDFAASIAPIKIDVLDLSKWMLHLDLTKITVQDYAALKLVITSPETMKLVLANISPQDIPKLAILIYDFGYQTRELNKVFLSVKESEKLKEVLRMIPSRQYPVVKFPFLELTNDDPVIYKVEVDRWLDIHKMQEDLKTGKYKLVMLMSERMNNCSLVELGDKVENYPLHGKEFEIVYQAVKEVRPDLPVGFIAVLFHGEGDRNTLVDWLSSFSIKPDVWLLLNVPDLRSNFAKLKRQYFADRPVIANLNHHSQHHDYHGQELGSVQYKETITNLKSLGFSGAIWWR